MAELLDWLKLTGLEAIAPLLAENDVTLDILSDLTEQDLEQLGLSLGQRRRLLKAVAAFPPDQVMSSRRSTRTAQAGSRHEAERRQVTVMFCDLVGSTELSGRLDPEEMSKVIRCYQDACAAAITRFNGFLAKLMGDGVLAYFGFPEAHEDSAEEAVQAALAIVAAIPGIKTPDGRRLQTRIGIATGLVVVGDIVGTGVARELSIIGETPNLAARLQALAAPDTILVSQSTRQLIGRIFEVESAGAHLIKGFPQAVPVWRVRGESAVASRFAAVRSVTLPPFIGREHEMGILLDRWQLAKSGDGQVILLVGEAGIGKSRMVEALCDRDDEDSKTVLSFQGSPHYLNTTLYPAIRYLELASEFLSDDTPPQRLEKLKNLLVRSGLDAETALPLFADLLSLPLSMRTGPPVDMSSAQQKVATISTFVDHVTRLARQSPVLFVLEDAHWIDPTTAELIAQLIDSIESARVLVVVTARPDFAASWTGRAHATQISLTRLGRAQSAQMVAGIASARAIPAALLDEIVAKTDGVPLFVEEVTKAFLESESSDRTSVPATLQDSLMARLDRLGEAKEIAQVASVIGRQFSHALLAAVSPIGGADLDKAIARLVKGEIVFPQRQSLDVGYSFKHALTRDAAYDSLLRTRREALHERIGKALEEHFPAVVEEEPELLAYHFGAAGVAATAARYRERAGDRAVAHSAYNEAVAHFSAALDETRKLPDHAREELMLLLKLDPALSILKSAQSQEVGEISRRAYEIAQTLGDGPELFKATWNLWYGDNMGRRSAAALSRAEELVALGQRLNDEDLLLEALHCRWSTALFGGDLAVAFKDSRDGVARYVASRHHQLGVTFGGHDPGVCAHAIQGMTLAFSGQFDGARAAIGAAVALAEGLGHTHTLAHAWVNAALTSQIVGDRAATSHASGRVVEISEKYGFPPQLAIGRFLSGWARAIGPELAAGLDLMEAEFMRAATLGPWPNHFATLLADVRLQSGRVTDAYQLIESTLIAIKGTDIGFYLPKLLQLRRDCLPRLSLQVPDDASGQLSAAIRFSDLHYDRIVKLKAAIASERGQQNENQVS